MIEVKGLRKSFGDKTIINGVDVSLKPGMCNLIIGSSGSGKSVFTKCLVGLFQPDSGQILYDGEDFIVMNTDQKKRDQETDWYVVSRLCFIQQHDS